MFPVRIFVGQDAIKRWGEATGRALTGTEEYAAAKMRLFQAFDEGEELSATESSVGRRRIESQRTAPAPRSLAFPADLHSREHGRTQCRLQNLETKLISGCEHSFRLDAIAAE